jgi:hypothetical protein
MGEISQKVVDGANCRAYILFIATTNGRRDEMRKLKKVQRRLDIRRSEFNRGPQGRDGDRQRSRWASGGYHEPGSNKK